MLWFIIDLTLVAMSVVGSCRVIRLGFKLINRIFDKLEDKM